MKSAAFKVPQNRVSPLWSHRTVPAGSLKRSHPAVRLGLHGDAANRSRCGQSWLRISSTECSVYYCTKLLPLLPLRLSLSLQMGIFSFSQFQNKILLECQFLQGIFLQVFLKLSLAASFAGDSQIAFLRRASSLCIQCDCPAVTGSRPGQTCFLPQWRGEKCIHPQRGTRCSSGTPGSSRPGAHCSFGTPAISSTAGALSPWPSGSPVHELCLFFAALLSYSYEELL